MGTWGTQPWENDGAGDKWDEVEDAAWAAARTVLRWSGATGTADKWERVGLLARMAVAFGTSGLSADEAGRCVDWLDDVLEDNEWLASWREPDKAVQSARLWRSLFDQALRAKQDKWSTGPSRSLARMVEKARKARNARKARKPKPRVVKPKPKPQDK